MTKYYFENDPELAKTLSIAETRCRLKGTQFQLRDSSGPDSFGYSYDIVEKETYKRVIRSATRSVPNTKLNKRDVPFLYEPCFHINDLKMIGVNFHA